MTLVEPALAAALHMEATGKADVASVGMQSAASFAQVALLEAGSHSLANQKVLVYDLTNLQAEGLNIQGVLGEDFLEQFDMLIDNAHKMLCLDESSAMRRDMKGNHIALVTPVDGDDVPPNSLIFPIHLSGSSQQMRLKLDSGANAPFLYSASKLTAIAHWRVASLHGSGTDGAQRSFVALPSQDMKIGSLEFSKVPFFTLASVDRNSSSLGFDGLLTMGLFRRVFICHSDHFAILEPR